MRDRSHDEAMSEQLSADPAYAAELFADVLHEDNPAEMDILLRQLSYVVAAQDQTRHD